jgi:hypothetical protein
MSNTSKKISTMKEAWALYNHAVLDPIGAGAVQRWETRVGFYAGASSILSIIMDHLTPGDDVEKSDIDKLDALVKELDEFTAQMKVHRR